MKMLCMPFWFDLNGFVWYPSDLVPIYTLSEHIDMVALFLQEYKIKVGE